MIGVEVDFYFVCFGRYDRQLEVQGIIWISIRVAAAVVHQDRPVPIGNSDKVGMASVAIKNEDGKGSELKPQYFPSFHSNVFGFLKVMRIGSRIVRRGDHTWSYNQSIFSKQLYVKI